MGGGRELCRGEFVSNRIGVVSSSSCLGSFVSQLSSTNSCRFQLIRLQFAVKLPTRQWQCCDCSNEHQSLKLSLFGQERIFPTMYTDAYALADDLNALNLDEPNVDEIRDLFRRDPTAAKYQDFSQQTLLHKCLEHFPHRHDLVDVFIEFYPEALMQEDDAGNLPIELFINKVDKKPQITFNLLVEICPEALLHENKQGQLPLHLACSSSNNLNCPRDSELIRCLVEAFPDALMHPDFAGMFPLQLACRVEPSGSYPDPPTNAIALMIDKAPHILTETIPDGEGRLPLHHLSGSSLYHDTVSVLVEKFPRALLLQDSENCTPLMNACMNEKASLDMVYCLVRQWPEQVTSQSANVFDNERFNGDMLPIAIASESASVERVRNWAEKQPRILSALDGFHKRVPLHYAAASRSPEQFSLVQCLLKIDPSAASIHDAMGRYPLHYAALSKSSEAVSVAKLLVNAFPDAMTAEDTDGMLPWHYAECANACFGSDVADFLYERTSNHDPGIYVSER